jgi:hypothetical protein
VKSVAHFSPPRHNILPALRQNLATDTTRTILGNVAVSLRRLKSGNLAAELEFLVEALGKNEYALAALLRLVVKGKQVQDGYKLSTAAATDKKELDSRVTDAIILECLGSKKYRSVSAEARDNLVTINEVLKARGLPQLGERGLENRLYRLNRK